MSTVHAVFATPPRRFAIATTPSLQDGIAKELATAGLLAHGEDREPRMPAYDDLPNLPYLTSVWAPSPMHCLLWRLSQHRAQVMELRCRVLIMQGWTQHKCCPWASLASSR